MITSKGSAISESLAKVDRIQISIFFRRAAGWSRVQIFRLRPAALGAVLALALNAEIGDPLLNEFFHLDQFADIFSRVDRIYERRPH